MGIVDLVIWFRDDLLKITIAKSPHFRWSISQDKQVPRC